MGDTEVTVAPEGWVSEANPYSTDSAEIEIVGSMCNGHKQKRLFTSENGLVWC